MEKNAIKPINIFFIESIHAVVYLDVYIRLEQTVFFFLCFYGGVNTNERKKILLRNKKKPKSFTFFFIKRQLWDGSWKRYIFLFINQ